MCDEIINHMRNLIKNNLQHEIIISPPTNLTGKLHSGHILNFSIADFYVRYNYIFGKKNIVNLFGYDHAGLSAEIVAKQDLVLENKEINLENICQQITYNISKFSKFIELQINKYNFAILNTYFKTNDQLSEDITYKVLSKLEQNQLISSKLQLYFYDTKNNTIVNDLDVEKKIVKKILYYVKYYSKDNKDNHLTVATTLPGTIEDDICLTCNDQDNRYVQFIGQEFINPLTKKTIKLFTHPNVKKEYGTGILKITPTYDRNDYQIAVDLKFNLDNIELKYDTKKLVMNTHSLFKDKHILDINQNAINILKAQNNIEKTEEICGPQYFTKRSNAIALTLMSEQICIDLKHLNKNTKYKYEEINIRGCSGKNEIFKFTKNLKDWVITRQNNYGISYKNHKLDTWVSSSIYIITLIWYIYSEENINRKITVYTAYDIMFYWIYKMHYMQSFYTNKKVIHNVVVHGLICDNKGNKMSKSKGNIIDINFEDKNTCENYKAGIMCLNIFDKRVTYDDNKMKIPTKTITKIKNIINLLKTKFGYTEQSIVYTTNHTTSLLYNIFLHNMLHIIDNNANNSINKIYTFHNFIRNYFGNIFVETFKLKICSNDYYNKIVISMIIIALQYAYCFMPIQANNISQLISGIKITDHINIKNQHIFCNKTYQIFNILKLQKEKKINTLTVTSEDPHIQKIFYKPDNKYEIIYTNKNYKLYCDKNCEYFNLVSIQNIIKIFT